MEIAIVAFVLAATLFIIFGSIDKDFGEVIIGGVLLLLTSIPIYVILQTIPVEVTNTIVTNQLEIGFDTIIKFDRPVTVKIRTISYPYRVKNDSKLYEIDTREIGDRVSEK